MKHKLTPGKRKALEIIEKNLPKIQKLNADGSPKWIVTRLPWTEGVNVPEDQRPKDWDPKKMYQQSTSAPALVNHKVNLTQAFLKGGDVAVNAYIKRVHDTVTNYKNSKSNNNQKPTK
jgi:hypothetical protein